MKIFITLPSFLGRKLIIFLIEFNSKSQLQDTVKVILKNSNLKIIVH